MKQKHDRIINGVLFPKSRSSLKGIIRPQATLIKNISINTLTNTEREKMNLSTTENMKNQMNIITNFGKIKSLISHKEKINYSIPESVEKNRHNNYGLNNRKFDIKINFNNTEIEEKNEKIMNINTQNKKFSFKDKKEYSENLRIILKKS